MRRLEVLAVVSEAYPLIKTGGLADVAGALPGALRAERIHVRTLLPGYPRVMQALRRATCVHVFPDHFGVPARLLQARVQGLDLFVLDAPGLYDRPGGPYVTPEGRNWDDNARRFAALGSAGALLGLGLLEGYQPDVVHAHDWQAGLAPAYLEYAGGRRPATVMTVHNLAFQGQFDRQLLGSLGLPDHAFSPDGVEYYGDIGFLKAGLRLADRITTVSPTYAAEICTPEHGMGLDGLLRGRSDRLIGILNGIDTDVWNPAQDDLISASFSAGDLRGRSANKRALQQELGLTVSAQAPLFGVVSRLSWQKGLDLLPAAARVILAAGGQLAILGAGDADLEAAFTSLSEGAPGSVACVLGYDEGLAHRIQAGSDALVVPSRFEPCGLTQLCALRYGAVPVAARVGGLNDTIIDASPAALAAGCATGVLHEPASVPMLEHGLRRTLALMARPDQWARIQANGMAMDVSWRGPAREYARLYREIVTEPGRPAAKG